MVRYLGVFILSFHVFRRSLSDAKCSFYEAVNNVFGKILNLALETVITELIKSKCMPILLYVVECFKLSKASISLVLNCQVVL